MGTNNAGQINYVNPAFKAEQVKTEAISPQTKVTYTTKPDEFVKEEGMSTGTKVAIGAGTLAVIGLGILAFVKGKGSKALKQAQKAAAQAGKTITEGATQTAEKAVEKAKEKAVVTVEGVAKKYKIKKYVTPDRISEINGVTYKEGKPYTGKVIQLWHKDIPIVRKYKNGQLVSRHQLLYKGNQSSFITDNMVEVERNGKYSTYNYIIDENGKLKITKRFKPEKLSETFSDTKYLQAKSIGQLPQHTYSEVPDVGVISRGKNRDFTYYKASSAATDPRSIYDKINYYELSDSRKVILAIGKSPEGKKVVFLQAPAGRWDAANRPVRNLVTLTSKGEEFSPAQLDLIKAVSGKTQEELVKEMPLARAFSVKPSLIHETVNIDTNTLLNEVAHFSTGRQIPQETQNLIAKLNSMPNDSYIRIVG